MSTTVGGGSPSGPSQDLGPYRRGYRDLRVFSGTGGSSSVTDLGDNTNLWGAPPSAARAAAAAVSAARAYPHPHAGPLVTVLAAHVGVAPDMVVAGAGRTTCWIQRSGRLSSLAVRSQRLIHVSNGGSLRSDERPHTA